MPTLQILLPDRYRQLDLFVCDLMDASPKDDLGSMEHPLFSIAKKPDTKIRTYEHNGNTVNIVPSVLGLATIFDKDILIYVISQLTAAMNRGREVKRTVCITAYDLLIATNRPSGGRGYVLLEKAFQRLAGTRIYTNVKVGGRRIREGFGLIESYRILEKSPDNSRMSAVEVTISEWLYEAICHKEVLTINRDYFRLRKGLERRLYELARKHCGKQKGWKISMQVLHKKSGAISSLPDFRRQVKNICKTSHLPDYLLCFDVEGDIVKFQPRDPDTFIQSVVQDLSQQV